MHIATVQEGVGHLADDRPPMSMAAGETLVVDSLEAVKIILHQAVKGRGLRISRVISACRLPVHNLRNGRSTTFAKVPSPETTVDGYGIVPAYQ